MVILMSFRENNFRAILTKIYLKSIKTKMCLLLYFYKKNIFWQTFIFFFFKSAEKNVSSHAFGFNTQITLHGSLITFCLFHFTKK